MRCLFAAVRFYDVVTPFTPVAAPDALTYVARLFTLAYSAGRPLRLLIFDGRCRRFSPPPWLITLNE